MAYRGSLPSGQPYNGQQQMPPDAYNQGYGLEQQPHFVPGYVASTPQHASPTMQYSGDAMSLNNAAYMGNYDASYRHGHAQYGGAPMAALNMPMQFQPTHLPPPTSQRAQLQRPPQLPQPLSRVSQIPSQQHIAQATSPVQQLYQQPTYTLPQPHLQDQAISPAPSQPSRVAPLQAHSQAQPQRPHVHPQVSMGNVNGVVSASYGAAEASRSTSSPQSAISRSPALSTKSSTKSPGISKRTPTIPPKPKPMIENVGILVAVAEDCIQAAHRGSQDIAQSSGRGSIWEYHKLISTGLACLEAALQSNKLSPRQEAKLRLRYASLLCEETENLMDAETTLTQGITLCEKHRYLDLKYCMQYLLLRVLFQRSQKAALKAVEGHIRDATALRHIHWVYAFRFLRATFHIQSSTPHDSAALENLRTTSQLASQRGDKALVVLASLMEALTIMKTMKGDTVERVQQALAQVSKFQLDPTVQIPQLNFLSSLVDLACTMHLKQPDVMLQKLQVLEGRFKENNDQANWRDTIDEILLPIRKPQSSATTISGETAAVLRPGSPGSDFDYLIMSFVTKSDVWALCMTFSGLAGWYRPSSRPSKSLDLWSEALNILAQVGTDRLPPASLRQSSRKEAWRRELFCYLQVLIGLYAATSSKWKDVRECLDNLKASSLSTRQSVLPLLRDYLTGCYYQGTGKLQKALEIFTNNFEISDQETGIVQSVKLDLSLLAALNRLWIMQHPSIDDAIGTAVLLEKVRPLCSDHHDPELRTAFYLMEATVSSASIPQVKDHIGVAFNLSRSVGNYHFLTISLCLLRSTLFENVVGDQAEKSALAAANQAKVGGNLLWRSVADGMLSNHYEAVGKKDLAAQARERGVECRRMLEVEMNAEQ